MRPAPGPARSGGLGVEKRLSAEQDLPYQARGTVGGSIPSGRLWIFEIARFDL